MMFERIGRIALALAAPLLLAGCLLAPGKFVSRLTINKDRSFTFAYKGEVIAVDPAADFAKGMKDAGTDAKDEKAAEPADKSNLADEEKPAKDEKAPDPETERKRRAIAEALTKEAGYRSATYLGDGKFQIDYEISGVLSHSFLFPFNSDAEIMFPFVVVEARSGNTARLRAPGFANDSDNRSKTGMGAAGDSDIAKFLDGEFTLDTDAEIVSQNNESGVQKAKGRQLVTWKASPLTRDAPVAVVRFTK